MPMGTPSAFLFFKFSFLYHATGNLHWQLIDPNINKRYKCACTLIPLVYVWINKLPMEIPCRVVQE